MKLFLYNNGSTSSHLLCLPLYAALAADPQLDLVVAIHRGDAELFAGLRKLGVTLRCSDYANGPGGAVVDLLHLCPSDYTPIHTWLQTYEDTLPRQWKNVLEVFRRELERQGLDLHLDLDADRVPLLDLPGPTAPTQLAQPSIFIDNTPDYSRHSYFVFDLERLSRTLPGYDLLCTATPDTVSERIFDCSHFTALQRSHLSEACELILGSGFDGLTYTLTEANRLKPKAVCGYDSRNCETFWDYPGNCLEYFGHMDHVIDFLHATLWERI